ncbi:MAG: carboxypeptidase regulatory-like domain-containing protein, partial [Planctomycetota bacterium]
MRWSDRTTATAAALALLVAAGWVIGLTARAVEVERRGAGRAAARSAGDDAIRAGAATAPEGAGPHAVPERREPAGDPDGTPRTPVASGPGVVRGRVVTDEFGAPVAGARVAVARRPRSEFRIPGNDAPDALAEVASTVRDAGGRFALDVPPAVPLSLTVRAPERAAARREPLFGGDEVTVRLARAAGLEGVLTRAEDAAPLEGSLVVGRN